MHNNICFWHLFIFRIGTHHENLLKLLCDYGQVDLFHSAGPHGESAFDKTDVVTKQERIWTRKKFLAVGKACMAIF